MTWVTRFGRGWPIGVNHRLRGGACGGAWLIEGEPLSSDGTQFELDFADGDQLTKMSRMAYEPVAVKEAGWLSPAEALALQRGSSPTESMALEGVEIEESSLKWTGLGSEALDVFAAMTAPAVRLQDMPFGPVVDRPMETPE